MSRSLNEVAPALEDGSSKPLPKATMSKPLMKPGMGKALVGGVLVGVIVVAAVMSIWASPFDPNAQTLSARIRPPVWMGGDTSHLLGTDHLGRDLLSRLMAGGRISLMIGASAVLMSCCIGILLGLTGAYYGKWLDSVLTMAAEVQLSLPSILIMIVFLALIGPSVITVALVLALSDWVIYARTIRAKVLVEKEKDYVVAARALGASDRRILFRHLLPNVFPTLMVLATVQLGAMILFESALSYLGLGVQRPNPTWGRMVGDGQPYLQNGWWLSTLPALTIGLVVLGANMLGDGLRQLWKME